MAESAARDPGHDSDLDLERRVEPLESLDSDLSLEGLEGLDRDSLDRDLSLPEAAVSRLIAGRESKLALGFARSFMSAITEGSFMRASLRS